MMIWWFISEILIKKISLTFLSAHSTHSNCNHKRYQQHFNFLVDATSYATLIKTSLCLASSFGKMFSINVFPNTRNLSFYLQIEIANEQWKQKLFSSLKATEKLFLHFSEWNFNKSFRRRAKLCVCEKFPWPLTIR